MPCGMDAPERAAARAKTPCGGRDEAAADSVCGSGLRDEAAEDPPKRKEGLRRMRKGWRAAGTRATARTATRAVAIFLCVWTVFLIGCGEKKEPPAGENAALREVRYYSRAYGEKEKEDALLRTVRFTVGEDGGIVRETYDPSGKLNGKEQFSPAGELLLSETYFLDEKGSITETNRLVYTLEDGKCVKEESYRDGALDLVYKREYDGQGALSYEQLVRIRDGEEELQYTHRYENSYDGEGHLTEQIYTNEEEPSQNTHTRYTYDEKGNLIRQAEIRYDREYTVTEYTRDEHGGILKERKLEDGVLQSEVSYRYEYDGEGRILRQEDLSVTPAAVTEYAYDGAGRCVRIVNSTDGKKHASSEFGYSYDGTLPLRITQTTLQYDGGTPAGDIYTTEYTYEGETTPEISALLQTLAAK